MCAKQWKNIIAKGDDALKNNNLKIATDYYVKSMSEAERMIKQTILNFDGETDMLGLYTASCKLVVSLCIKANKKNDAAQYIDEACNKIFDVIKNPGYPIAIRGKSIRAFEILFKVIEEVETSNANIVINKKLKDLKMYIQQMQSFQLEILRN